MAVVISDGNLIEVSDLEFLYLFCVLEVFTLYSPQGYFLSVAYSCYVHGVVWLNRLMVKFQRQVQCYRFARFVAIGLVISLLASGFSLAFHRQAIAQTGTISNAITSALPPPGVSRYGALEVIWVESPQSGENLLQIAAPTVADRANPAEGQLPVEVRSQNIEDLIWLETTRIRDRAVTQLFGQIFRRTASNPSSPPRASTVIVSTLRGLPVLQISNAERSRPLTIATVTPADQDFYSETSEQLAAFYKELSFGLPLGSVVF